MKKMMLTLSEEKIDKFKYKIYLALSIDLETRNLKNFETEILPIDSSSILSSILYDLDISHMIFSKNLKLSNMLISNFLILSANETVIASKFKKIAEKLEEAYLKRTASLNTKIYDATYLFKYKTSEAV